MGLTRVFLLLFFIAPQAFAHNGHGTHRTLSATVVTAGIDVTLSGAQLGFELYGCNYPSGGTACTLTTLDASNRLSGWVNNSTNTFEHRSLNPGTVYLYKAIEYESNGTHTTNQASATTPNAPSLAASKVQTTTATLTISNHSTAWWYKGNQGGAQCTSVGAGTTTVNLTGLTPGTSYTYKAYSNNTCATELTTDSTDADFTTLLSLNLEVTASNSSGITLSWTQPTGQTGGYDVYRCTVRSDCMTLPTPTGTAVYLSWVENPPSAGHTATKSGNTFTLVDTNATEKGGSSTPIIRGETYHYAIIGYSPTTAWSYATAQAGTPPPPPPPSKPVGLTVTSISAEAVSLRWKPSSGSDEKARYGVYRCTVPEGKTSCDPYNGLWLAHLNSNAYTDTEVTPGETYRYQVAAEPLGRDNLSRAVTVTVGSQMSEMAPSPTGLMVTETTEAWVRLSWTAPEDDGKGPIQAIDIYRCNVDRSPDCSEFMHVASRNPVLTDYWDNYLEPGTTYRYAVAAYRSAEEVSPWSNQVTATTQRGPYVAAPTGLKVTAASRVAISLSWTAPADGILGYNVYRCTVPAGGTTCEPEWHAWVANPGDAPPAPTAYTDSGGETGGIAEGLTYLYKVSASYPPGYTTGDRSDAVTATARGEPAPEPGQPAPPTGLTALSGENGISLSWSAPSDDIVGYSIYRCEEGETPCTPEWLAWVANEGDVPPAPTEYVDTDVSFRTTYRYAATSNNIDSDGEYHESEWSEEVTVEPREGSPGAPTNLTATPGDGQITLSWTPPAGTVTGWELLVRTETDTGSWMSITPGGATTKSYTVTGLTNGVQYTFLVRAVNGMLKGAPAGHRGPATVPSANAGEFAASFASGSQWFRRDVIPILSGKTTWSSVAWKGERIQQHILVNNVPSNSRISLVPGDLASEANDTIPANAVSFRYPGFVAGHTEARSCGKDYQAENTTAYLSDALFAEPVQSLPASWPELVWMSVDIPAETPPGEYAGTVIVRAVSATAIDSEELHLSIEVAPWAMPDAAERQFHLDLWQFPVSVLDRYNDANPGDRIEIWSEDHYALLEPTYRYLAGLGQRTVTTYIKEGALGAPSMIRWTLARDGAWGYDYSVFDAYVTRLAAWGLDQQVSAFSPVGWNGGDIPYWDETNQREETFSAGVGSSDWNERWKHFLTDFGAHLLEKGWFDKTVLYLDESAEEDVQAVLDLVETVDESWKVGLAYIGYGRDGPGERVLSELYDSSGSMALVGTTYVDTGLVTGETYRYAVDGCNDDCSAASSPVTVVAQSPAVPGEPTGLAATSATGVTLSWTAPATIGSSALTGYDIYRCVDEPAPCAPAWFGRAGTGATYTDSNVTIDTTYRYAVAACNGSGCGDKSGAITVMAGGTFNEPSVGSDEMTEPDQTPQNRTVPDVPTDLAAFAASPAAIQLGWEGNATNGYDVYRCIGSETCTPVAYLGWTYADTDSAHPDRISTFYTSCVQPRPNSFVAADADPSDVAALPWHALQRRQDGYLRWAFDNWRSSDPLDVREGAFTAGDFSLVYRSSNDRSMTVVPSIRSEMLRDGIEDFEKVQVLRSSLSGCAEDELAGRWLDRLERTVDAFSSSPLMAGRAGELIGEAHDRLGEISLQLTPDMCQ